MNEREAEIWRNGEKGQGENLVTAKMKKEAGKLNHSKEHSYSSRSSSNSGKFSPVAEVAFT